MYKILLFFTSISLCIACLIAGSGLVAQPVTGVFSCGDTIIDVRDGQAYPTVQIGSQCWMAKNLNTGQMVSDFMMYDNNIIEKSCYNNDPSNCDVFGGLYIWSEAMQGNTAESGQGICPSGWHIPSRADWDQLRRYLGYSDAGQHLKHSTSEMPRWDGTNESGFSALPAGVGYEGHFGRINQWSIFWSSTQADTGFAWFAQLDNFWYPAPPKYKILYLGNHFVKENGFSVRCIRSEP